MKPGVWDGGGERKAPGTRLQLPSTKDPFIKELKYNQGGKVWKQQAGLL